MVCFFETIVSISRQRLYEVNHCLLTWSLMKQHHNHQIIAMMSLYTLPIQLNQVNRYRHKSNEANNYINNFHSTIKIDDFARRRKEKLKNFTPIHLFAAIVVYDSGRDLTWRLSHPAMFPDPNFAQSNILGNRFTLMDGIVGITFDTSIGVVYFQPLATDR